jgi:hypothetical protein
MIGLIVNFKVAKLQGAANDRIRKPEHVRMFMMHFSGALSEVEALLN